MKTQPYVLNLGDFPVVVPEGKVIKFQTIGIDPGYDVSQIPPVLGPCTLVLRAMPVLDEHGHQYAVGMIWMEDEV